MTQRVDTDFDMDLTSLIRDDEEIEELYEGAPASFSEPGDESPEYDASAPTQQVPPVNEGNTLLLNLRFMHETILIDDVNLHEGKVQFDDGWLAVPTAVVDKVIAAAPYVFIEPTEGPVFHHQDTGFKTRNASAYEEFVRQYYENL